MSDSTNPAAGLASKLIPLDSLACKLTLQLQHWMYRDWLAVADDAEECNWTGLGTRTQQSIVGAAWNKKRALCQRSSQRSAEEAGLQRNQTECFSTGKVVLANPAPSDRNRGALA